MTRVTAVAAAFVGALALVAASCGGDDDEGAAGTTAATTATTTTQPQALKVGLITDLGQLDDNGFNELAYRGLQRAEKELGIQGRVVESRSAADYVPNMTALVRQGYSLIIGVGFAQGNAVATAARRYTDVKFAIVDVDQTSLKGTPPNVAGLLFKEQEVGYLAGYLAALTAKRDGANGVSAVGGFKEPPVDRFIAGYRAGALKAVPGISVRWGYSSDWDDQAKCKELALNQIAAGSAVIFQVAGGCGLGALSAAKDKQVWGIGVDGDQSFLGPHVLTSALKGVDEAVFQTIEKVQDGTFEGGNAVFGLEQDAVGLGTMSPKANKEDVAKLEQLEGQLTAGQLGQIPTTLKG